MLTEGIICLCLSVCLFVCASVYLSFGFYLSVYLCAADAAFRAVQLKVTITHGCVYIKKMAVSRGENNSKNIGQKSFK